MPIIVANAILTIKKLLMACSKDLLNILLLGIYECFTFIVDDARLNGCGRRRAFVTRYPLVVAHVLEQHEHIVTVAQILDAGDAVLFEHCKLLLAWHFGVFYVV